MRVPDLLGTETNGEGRTLLIYVSYPLAKTRKGVIHFMDNPLIFLARPLGLEPRTFGFVENHVSI